MIQSTFRPALAAACWLAFTSVPQAQIGTPEYDPLGEHIYLPRMVRVQVEFIEVSHGRFTELMFGPKTSANDTELRARLAELAKEGNASVVETLMCISKSGQKATSEAIREFIYPTEYDPPKFGGASQDKPPVVDPKSVVGPSPTAWDVRNLGGTLEIEPNLSDDDRVIDVRLLPEIVYHTGNQVWTEWRDDRGKADIQMPDFYTLRISTSVFLADGQPLMIGALSPKNDKGETDPSRKLMVFARADILTVGK